MPTLIALTLILLVITPPCYGILVILLDRHTPPRQRTTRALGGTLLFKSAGLGSLMVINLADSLQMAYLLPSALVALVLLCVTRVMQLELWRQERCLIDTP